MSALKIHPGTMPRDKRISLTTSVDPTDTCGTKLTKPEFNTSAPPVAGGATCRPSTYEPTEHTCPAFIEGDRDKIKCELHAALQRRYKPEIITNLNRHNDDGPIIERIQSTDEEIEQLITQVNQNCPLINIWTMMQALEAAEVKKEEE